MVSAGVWGSSAHQVRKPICWWVGLELLFEAAEEYP